MSSTPTDHDCRRLQFYQRYNSSLTSTDDHQLARILNPIHEGPSNMLRHVSSIEDATVVTTTVNSSSNSTRGVLLNTNSSNSCSSSYLNPERRVSKPIRRRRASRGAPITLLNTDTHNFRAMVQQFTGVPNLPFSLASQQSTTGATNLSFELARHPFHHHQDHPSILMTQQTQQQQQLQQQLQPRQQVMFSLNNINSTTTTTGVDLASADIHHQDDELINNLRLPNNNMDEQVISSGGFLMQSSISHPNMFHGSSSNGDRSSNAYT